MQEVQIVIDLLILAWVALMGANAVNDMLPDLLDEPPPIPPVSILRWIFLFGALAWIWVIARAV